jgi:hypothetical protein
MTSLEFEILTQKLLANRLRDQLGRDIHVHQGRAYKSLTGNTHQVDVSFTFELLGLEYLNIVECKLWDTPVPKHVIATLHSIVQDLKAHKGIVVSARGFQSGAISYAQSKGIGLFKIVNGEIGEVLSHFDGGLAKIGKQLLEDSNLIEDGNYDGVGMFFPVRSPYQFIAERYGKEFAQFLEHEYSADMLDVTPLRIDPVVRKQLRMVPDEWHKEYDLMETAGLGYKLANEPEMRVLSRVIWMLKTCI